MTNNQKYRIKKVTRGTLTIYHPQFKFFGLFWVNADQFGFDTYEEANKAYCEYLRNYMEEPIVEYFELSC